MCHQPTCNRVLCNSLYTVYDTAPAAQPYTEQPGPKVPASCQTPEDCFSLFFDDILLQYLVDTTNSYAEKKLATMTISSRSLYRNWRPVTAEEMKGFIAVVLNMGIVQLTNLKDYWSTDYTTNFPVPCFPETGSSRSLACCTWEIQMAPPSAAKSNPCSNACVQCLRPPSYPTSRSQSMRVSSITKRESPFDST